MANKDMPSVDEALNEYFSLKNKFEEENKAKLKKITNNKALSNKEKRIEYSKLNKKCVNCKKPSKLGTIFSTTFHRTDETEKGFSHRSLRALCGNVANPCNLKIEINIIDRYDITDYMNEVRESIKEKKNMIIDYKNKLLFGLTTTETALEQFDTFKRDIEFLTNNYEILLEYYNKTVDSSQRKTELEETTILLYENINKIKECIKKMHDEDNNEYAKDAAEIYYQTAEPLLKKIRHLKYKVDEVYNNDYGNCVLFQKYSDIDDLLFAFSDDEVVSYDMGLSGKKDRERDIESEIELELSGQQEGGFKKIKFGKNNSKLTPDDEEYKQVLSGLPEPLRIEFELNKEWENEFINKCASQSALERIEEPCRLTSPPNLVIPPREMDNGEYDFGVSIYNKVFNKQPKTAQQKYLTFYVEAPITKEKDYSGLEDILNQLVEVEVGYRKSS